MDGFQRVLRFCGSGFEITLLLGCALAGLCLLPFFCLWQAVKGDALWFWPKYAKVQPPPRRGGHWDHPQGPWDNDQ